MVMWFVVAGALLAGWRAEAQVHVIEVTADKDSRYKIAGQRVPGITVKAGEQVLLRVTANRGRTWNRDGSIHGFTLLRARDRTRVEGWDLLLKPGKQEFLLTEAGKRATDSPPDQSSERESGSLSDREHR